MAEREQILADFQACTGNEDVEESIVILEQHNWNLMEAVQNAMSSLDFPYSDPAPPASAFAPPSYLEATAGVQRPAFGAAVGVGVGDMGFMAAPVSDPGGEASAAPVAATGLVRTVNFGSSFASTSTDTQPIRLLTFTVEYRDRNVQVVLPDNENVGKLKQHLETELGVPAAQQVLCGWVNKNVNKVQDQDTLRELRLPRENTLFLLTPDTTQPTVVKPNNGESPNIHERLSQTFTLNIRFKDKEKLFTLNFPGSRTIQEVKGDVFALTDVPVRHQIWSGWPAEAQDETMTLAGCGVGFPSHTLGLCTLACQSKPFTRESRNNRRPKDDEMEVDSEDEYEDAHENFNIDEFESEDYGSARRTECLMPENATDETEALESFSREFANRYGECQPVFYIGTLDSAIREALQCKARDRKLLAIYLHHDASILSNVFCSQVLCAETIVAYLSANFITWAWDLTSETNRARLLAMCTRHFGSVAASTVKNFKPDELPLFLIISRTRATNEVVNVIRGNATLDELMTQLIQATDLFRDTQQREIITEDEREARESVKREQDDAYQESLAVDKAKAEAKKKEENEQRKKEEEEQLKQWEEEQKRKEEEMAKEAMSKSLAEQLPDEPPHGCTEPISVIRFRSADGQVIVRRFLAQNPLQVLLNFIASEGYHTTDFKVLTTFPRRDLTQLDPMKTLEELRLYPQETVILEEK